MAVKLLAFAFILVVTSWISFMVEAQILPQDPLAPIYFSDSPMMSPVYYPDSQISPVYDEEIIPFDNSPIMAPIYFSDSPVIFSPSDPPMVTPVYPPAPPTPRPHIPKRCAVGCVKYCRLKPKNTSKRTCQRICSVCCQQCNCIPMHEKPMSCGNWDKIMYHDVQVTCP